MRAVCALLRKEGDTVPGHTSLLLRALAVMARHQGPATFFDFAAPSASIPCNTPLRLPGACCARHATSCEARLPALPQCLSAFQRHAIWRVLAYLGSARPLAWLASCPLQAQQEPTSPIKMSMAMTVHVGEVRMRCAAAGSKVCSFATWLQLEAVDGGDDAKSGSGRALCTLLWCSPSEAGARGIAAALKGAPKAGTIHAFIFLDSG